MRTNPSLKSSRWGTATSTTGRRWSWSAPSPGWPCPGWSSGRWTSRWPPWTPTTPCPSCTSAPSTWRRQRGCTSVSVKTGSFNSRSVSLRYCSHPLNYLHRFDWIFFTLIFHPPRVHLWTLSSSPAFLLSMVLAVPNYGPDRPIRRLMLISAVSKPVDEIILRFFWRLSVDWDVVYTFIRGQRALPAVNLKRKQFFSPSLVRIEWEELCQLSGRLKDLDCNLAFPAPHHQAQQSPPPLPFLWARAKKHRNKPNNSNQ